MAQYNALGSWGWLDSVDQETLSGVDVILGDVRDQASVINFMRDASVVYHLAALIAIPYSYQAPASYLETNARGTLNVLEAARSLGTSRVIHTSTSEVYGTARHVPIAEDHPLQAQSPYSASKIAADKFAESYHLSFSIPVVTLRPFNTYGPRQSARAVIPTIVSQVAADAAQVRLGSLAPARDFTFVADVVEAFVAVGAAPDEAVVGKVLNAGSGTETTIADLVDRIGQIMGRRVEVVEEQDRVWPDRSEVMRLVSDARHLTEATGWRPRYSLEDGLRATAEWFCEPTNLQRYKTAIYNV